MPEVRWNFTGEEVSIPLEGHSVVDISSTVSNEMGTIRDFYRNELTSDPKTIQDESSANPRTQVSRGSPGNRNAQCERVSVPGPPP
jgi:hypothetical protein